MRKILYVIEFLKKIPPGDLEANIASIEPSMKRAHSVIGKGAKELDIYQNRSHLANFDIETKNYLNTNIVKEGFIEKQLSVGSFNANSGNGSIYDPILARTVPFSLAKFPKEGTRESLSYSLDRYTNGVGSLIDVTCQEIVAHDGRIKRLIIHAASPVLFAE